MFQEQPPLPLADVTVPCFAAWSSKCIRDLEETMKKACRVKALEGKFPELKRDVFFFIRQNSYVTQYQCAPFFEDVKAQLVFFPVFFVRYLYCGTTYNFRVNAQVLFPV